MRNKLMNILVILLCVISFAIIGKAQSINRLVFETTFDFIVRKQTFPAGKYTVERVNPADPKIMVLKGIGGEAKIVFLTYSMISDETMEKSQIIFEQNDEGHFLSGIWVSGETTGYDILPDQKAEEKR